MSLTRKAASNLACPARCCVLPVVCLHGCGAWSRSMVAERRHGQCTKKTLRLFPKDARGRGGRGGGGGDFLERGGVVSLENPCPWKSAQHPPLPWSPGRVPSKPPSPPSGSLERARSSFWGKVTGFISLPFSSRSAPLLRQAAFHRNWARRKIWRRHSACQLFQ